MIKNIKVEHIFYNRLYTSIEFEGYLYQILRLFDSPEGQNFYYKNLKRIYTE